MSFISPHKVFAPANSDGDPIILSRLDCDVYKFIMGQFIFDEGKADIMVTFGLKVRTKGVKLGRVIPKMALMEQLNALLKLEFSETELAQLAGMTIVSKDGIERHLFTLRFINELKRRGWEGVSFELNYLPDGTVTLRFTGPWLSVMFVETSAMAIISELYYWHLWQQHGISAAEFGSFYAELYQRTIRDCRKLSQYPDITFSQFGHRRRHSRMWEVMVQEVMEEMIPTQCTAPSNVWLAFKMGQNNPKGTNAHELPMVWATLNGNTDEWIRQAPYDLVERWNRYYPELAVLLADTFGTTAFLKGAPTKLAHDLVAARLDSKVEEEGIPEFVDWFRKCGADPMKKLYIPSDGLNTDRMIELDQTFRTGAYPIWKDRKSTFGCGTFITNQINGILPAESGFHTLSMVIKVIYVDGIPTVKLSDNPEKYTGEDQAEIARYVHIWGHAGEHARSVVV